jgi:IclR family transcriptional regulator, acetate operon repressor
MSDTSSVDRAFAILELFERERRPLSLKELADLCRIPASTCHSLVHTLLKRSYLYQAGRRKDLYPTRRLYDMGATILAHDPLLQRLLPVMETLREVTRETVILGKRQKDGIVYLEVLESPEVIRYSARPGDTKPLHSTCIGKTILSALKHDEVRRWLDDHPPAQVTGNTITSFTALIENLEEGRKRGFFTTRGENVADVTALSVPVSVNNELLGLAVAGPSHRIDARFEEVARALKDAQATLLEQGIAGHG